MKKLPVLLLILTCTTLLACSKGQEINGHNTSTAYRSVKALKNRLSPDNRIEFEVSFWTIRDAKKMIKTSWRSLMVKRLRKLLQKARKSTKNEKQPALKLMISIQAGKK